MSVNLSIKDVPDDLAARLRERAQRNHRSLQGELMAIVEAAAREPAAAADAAVPGRPAGVRGIKTIEQIAQAARQRFPQGTASSVELIRALRDSRHARPPTR